MSTAELPKEHALLTHRLVEVPLRDDDDRLQGRHRISTAIAGAHVTGAPIVVAWVRPRTGGPVLVLVGGVVVAAGNGSVAVGFPAGARGRVQDPQEVEAVLAPLTWEQSRLALDAQHVEDESIADRIEELFSLGAHAMAMLVIARPLSAQLASDAIDSLSDEIARLEALRSGRGVHRRQLARSEANLEYLDRSAGPGCWQLEVWTGGSSMAEARGVAAALAGSADLADIPLVLRPADADVASQFTWAPTCVVGPDVVAAIARPPFRELPGIRVTTLPDFDQNVEDAMDVRLGVLLNAVSEPAAPFGLSLDNINRHVFVTGATGSGKSETVRRLLWSLNQREVPWLVIEPAKAEYADLGPWLDPTTPLVVIRPGEPGSPPPMLNPLEPSSITVGGVQHTFPLQTHLDLVRALFMASFEAHDPFPQVLSAGLTGAYMARGWNLVTGLAADPGLSPPEWPTLGDLVRESLRVVDGLGYSTELRNDVRGFIRVRVESLRSGTPGRFFEGGQPLDLADLMNHPAVFEIEDVGDDQDKAFFIGSVIIRVIELLRLRQKHGLQQPGLRHVLVIEEAHRLLRAGPDSPAGHAVTMFANLLAEIRAYGEGVVVAEQIPSKVIEDLIKNSAVKLMHRLPALDDRKAVGATMNLEEAQSARVVALEPGTAVAHAAGMDRPVLVRIERVQQRKRTGAVRGAPRLGVRSPTCTDDCAAHLCTLGEIARSRDLVTPEVAIWVEQVVIAHLTWDRVGTPSGRWFARLQATDARRARCAIGLAVDDSVARRWSLIRRWLDPAEFAASVADRLASQLASGRGLDRPPGKWTVGQFRVAPVRRALMTTSADDDRGQSHPNTARWLALGIDLPGPSWDEQLAQLENYRLSLRPVRSAELAGSPSVLDELAQAMGVQGSSEQQRIATALASLGLDYKWLVQRVGARGD